MKISLVLLFLVCAVSKAHVIENDGNNLHYYPSHRFNLVKLGDHNYLAVDQMSTWMEASYFCNSHGMDLVTIETEQENDLIMAHIEKLGMFSRYIWTGAHKLGRSTFLWQNGECMIFTDWKSGQPESPATEHCMIIANGDWYDWRCHSIEGLSLTQKTAFICEQRS